MTSRGKSIFVKSPNRERVSLLNLAFRDLLEMMFDEGDVCGVALNMIQYIPHEFRK